MSRLAYRVSHGAVAPLSKLLWRPTVTGKGNVPRTGGVLLASNHLSFIDSFAIPIAVTILVALFYLQSVGTARVGRLFGPIMLIYFAVLAVLGIMHIVQQPEIFQALNPVWAFRVAATDGTLAFLALGSVVPRSDSMPITTDPASAPETKKIATRNMAMKQVRPASGNWSSSTKRTIPSPCSASAAAMPPGPASSE